MVSTVGPVSTRYPPSSSRPARPPGSASRSTTVTRRPAPSRCSAADRPASPAPTTTTWSVRPGTVRVTARPPPRPHGTAHAAPPHDRPRSLSPERTAPGRWVPADGPGAARTPASSRGVSWPRSGASGVSFPRHAHRSGTQDDRRMPSRPRPSSHARVTRIRPGTRTETTGRAQPHGVAARRVVPACWRRTSRSSGRGRPGCPSPTGWPAPAAGPGRRPSPCWTRRPDRCVRRAAPGASGRPAPAASTPPSPRPGGGCGSATGRAAVSTGTSRRCATR